LNQGDKLMIADKLIRRKGKTDWRRMEKYSLFMVARWQVESSCESDWQG
jgi:hypothetical protein